MTELSEEARTILEEGAEAALPGRSVADANWAALRARLSASPPAAAPRAPQGTLGAVGKWVVAGALVLGGAGVVALGVGGDGPHEEAVSAPPVAADPAAEGVAPAPVELPGGAGLAPRSGGDAPPPPALGAKAKEGAAAPREDVAAAAADAAEGAARPRTTRAARPSRRSSGDPIDELAEEERLVRAARRELPRDPEAALRRVAVYQRRFPAGVLAQEAAATRILALCQLGRREEGERLAAEFARAWPDAPALARVRGACREPDAP